MLMSAPLIFKSKRKLGIFNRNWETYIYVYVNGVFFKILATFFLKILAAAICNYFRYFCRLLQFGSLPVCVIVCPTAFFLKKENHKNKNKAVYKINIGSSIRNKLLLFTITIVYRYTITIMLLIYFLQGKAYNKSDHRSIYPFTAVFLRPKQEVCSATINVKSTHRDLSFEWSHL